MEEIKKFDFVVVGGGIAGISAIEQISFRLPQSSILLLTASSYVKVANTRLKLTSRVEELDIQQKSLDDFHHENVNVTVLPAKLECIQSSQHIITTSSGQKFGYHKLCLCTGSIPRLLQFTSKHIIGLRDTDSAIDLKMKLVKAKKICIVGNGGIATELIHELKNIRIVWIIRDKHIASTFVDSGAAEFLMDSIRAPKEDDAKPAKALRYTIASGSDDRLRKSNVPGAALGPNWHDYLELSGALLDKSITIEYQSEVADISDSKPKESEEDWPVYVTLNNGKVIGSDFVVSATGVVPFVPSLEEGKTFDLGEDGGVLVNESMETSIPDVYAAGDVCTVSWKVSLHWFQMRLWSQARPMGGFAGQCMAASFLQEPKPPLDFSFELFTHVTRFLGFKVVLLGLFNGQKLDGRYEALVRVTRGMEYIKLVVQDGKLHGAILIGETEMEETFENLILNQLDVSRFGENLLNPDVDIDDYFD